MKEQCDFFRPVLTPIYQWCNGKCLRVCVCVCVCERMRVCVRVCVCVHVYGGVKRGCLMCKHILKHSFHQALSVKLEEVTHTHTHTLEEVIDSCHCVDLRLT